MRLTQDYESKQVLHRRYEVRLRREPMSIYLPNSIRVVRITVIAPSGRQLFLARHEQEAMKEGHAMFYAKRAINADIKREREMRELRQLPMQLPVAELPLFREPRTVDDEVEAGEALDLMWGEPELEAA